MIVLDLPFPVSLWRAYTRNRATGKQFPSREYVRFQNDSAWSLRAQKARLPDGQAFSFDIALISDTWITKAGSMKRKDAENYVKTLIDTLATYFNAQGQAFDDCQIVDLRVRKIWEGTCLVPKAVVTIEAIAFPGLTVSGAGIKS